MRLDELSDVNMGQSPAGDSLNDSTGVEFHQGKIYFGDLELGQSPTRTNASTKLAKPGDVLMCVRAPVGVVNLTDREICIGRGLAALTPKAGVPKRFLLHLLRYHQAAVEQMATGSTFASITTEQLKSLEIPVPDRQSWLRIAGVLGSLDEKIALNRKKIAELEALAKTIYDYWFVQFDFPDKNGKPYKSSGGKMVWNEQLKCEVPEGWEVGTVEDLGEIVSGGTPSTSTPEFWTTNGITWITPRDLASTSNKYIRHGEHDISEEGLHNSSAQLMPKQSILLSTRAPIGYIAIADHELCTNQGFKSVIPSKRFGSEFVYYTILALVPYIKTLGVGSTFAEVSKSSFASVHLVLPSHLIVEQFDKIASSIGNARRICELELEESVMERDTLLPLLMNGQVIVK